MNDFYIVRQAVRTCVRFRLRTGLVAGIAAAGVASVIVSANYAAAGRKKVLEQLRRMGTDVVSITPRQMKSVAGRPKTGETVTTLRLEDERALRANVPGILRSSEVVSGSFLVKAGDLSKPGCTVIGCDPQYFALENWPVWQGRSFDTREARSLARVAVLGYRIARDLFPDDSPVGQRIMINRVPATVIGVLAERGQGLDASDEDRQVYVPASTATARLLNRRYLNAIEVQLGSEREMKDALAAIDQVMRRLHRPRSGLPIDYRIQNQQQTVETLNASSKRLTALVRSIGVTGLVVSGLGVFGVCWIAIRNRTRELGIWRAIGATGSDILLQVMLESALASALGTAIGVAAARLVSPWAEREVGMPIEFSWTTAIGMAVFALVLNQVFGLAAVARAARIDPATALKYE